MKETFYDKIFKPKTYTLENGKEVKQRASRVPLIIVLLVIAMYLSFQATDSDLSLIFTRGYQFFVILIAMFPPNFNYISNMC